MPGPLQAVPRRLLALSLADCVFVALTCWLLASVFSESPDSLLHDAATGFHIRNGEAILTDTAALTKDPFSFSQSGQEYYSLEWLSGVIFFWLFAGSGLKGVIILAGVICALTTVMVLLRLINLGANALVGLFVIHITIGASSVHFLARPHLFTLLFLATAMLLIDGDTRRRSRALWWLVPLTALWANLHGGFLALLLTLGILAAGFALEALLFGAEQPARWRRPRRYLALLAGCSAAACVNPRGPALILHLVTYIRQEWMLTVIEEYQSPRFHSSDARYIEILIVGAILTAAWLVWKQRLAPALLVLAWAHASLTSIRHVPILAIVAAPWIAVAATDAWNSLRNRFGGSGFFAALDGVAGDHRASLGRLSLWPALFVLCLILLPAGAGWPRDFTPRLFPIDIINRNSTLISGTRLFSMDRWNDYLLFRFYPRQKIFIDGRVGGFFSEAICNEYTRLIYAQDGWSGLLERHNIESVLLPPDSGLATALQTHPDWETVDRTPQAKLFIRSAPAMNHPSEPEHARRLPAQP